MLKLFLLLLCPLISLGQKSTIRHIDTLITKKYKIIKDFYANDNGFMLMEQKFYLKSNTVETEFTNGKIVDIDSDSLRYKRTNNGVVWINLTSTFDNYFTYHLTKKRDGVVIKYKELEVSKCYVELPIMKAKQFIKEIW